MILILRCIYCAHCNKELREYRALSAITILGDQRLLLGVCVFSGIFFSFSLFSVCLHWIDLRQMDKEVYFWGAVLTTIWMKSYTFNIFFRIVRSHLLGIDCHLSSSCVFYFIVYWAHGSFLVGDPVCQKKLVVPISQLLREKSGNKGYRVEEKPQHWGEWSLRLAK